MAFDRPAEIQTLGTRIVYENQWMRVREDDIRRPDGSTSIYGVVEKANFVAVAAVESDQRLHLVQQFRYPVGKRSWELPQGAHESDWQIEPLELARAELREETGVEAEEMVRAGFLFIAPGFSTHGYHVFLAKGLRQGKPRLEADEQGLISRAFPLIEIEAMIRDGEIQDATTIATLGYLRLRGMI